MFSNVKTLDVMLYSKALVCLDKVICFDKSVIHRMQFSDKVKAFYYSQICFLLFLDLHTQKKSTFAANVKCLSNMLNAFQINNWILNLLTAHDMLFREEFKFFLWYLFSRCSCFAVSASSQQVRELPKNQRKRQAITLGRKMSSLFSQLHPTPQRFFFHFFLPGISQRFPWMQHRVVFLKLLLLSQFQNQFHYSVGKISQTL